MSEYSLMLPTKTQYRYTAVEPELWNTKSIDHFIYYKSRDYSDASSW